MTSALLMLMACSGAMEDSRYPTGTHLAVATADYKAIYSANPAVGSVTRVDFAGGGVLELELGGEPTRLARVGDLVLATLRSDRSLAVIQEKGESSHLLHTVHLGAEPFGVVASEDGSRVYVSLSMEDRVLELDGETLTPTRSFDIPDEPRWMALAPQGGSLFVASAFNGRLSHVDLDSGAVTQLELPEVVSTEFDSRDTVTLSARFTGDMAISPDGDLLVAPAMWVDNLSSVEPKDPATPDVVPKYYGAPVPPLRLGRFNGGLLHVPLTLGQPDVDRAGVQPIVGRSTKGVVRSAPSSATFSPRGDMIVVTVEGSEAVVTTSRKRFKNPQDPDLSVDTSLEAAFFGTDDPAADRGPESVIDARFVRNGVAFTATNSMPQAAVFLERRESLWVTSGLTHELEEIDYREAVRMAKQSHNLGREMTVQDIEVTPTVPLTELELPEGVQEGRLLFHSAISRTMSSGDGGVACATCHVDSRTDGLTWNLEGTPRQTPSLAGPVSHTAPVTWFDEVPTVAEEAKITSEDRMGGPGLEDEHADQIEAFVDWTREPDIAADSLDAEAISRGQAIFEQEAVGCAECHVAPLYTDNKQHSMYGADAVTTPSLVGVAATPPYLHSGVLHTLEAVLESARDGEMGNTGGLTDEEMADLETFLRSL